MDRGILAWVIIGLLAGAIAKLLMPGRDPGGIFVTIVIGILGSILGGWLGAALLGAEAGPAGLLGSVVGALVLLGVYRLVIGRRDVAP